MNSYLIKLPLDERLILIEQIISSLNSPDAPLSNPKTAWKLEQLDSNSNFLNEFAVLKH